MIECILVLVRGVLVTSFFESVLLPFHLTEEREYCEDCGCYAIGENYPKVLGCGGEISAEEGFLHFCRMEKWKGFCDLLKEASNKIEVKPYAGQIS